jgi:hypothetical protein
MKSAYTMAACFPVMVVGNPEEYPHLSARIRGIIGPTTPLAGQEGQMRYDYRATHRVLNLIHGTDDPGSAIRESLVFFSVEEVINVIRLASQTASYGTLKKDFSEMNNVLLPKQDVDITNAVVKYRAKDNLLNEIKSSLSRISFEKGSRFLELLRADLHREENIIKSQYKLEEEVKFLQPVLYSERAIVYLLINLVKDSQRIVSRSEVPFSQKVSHESELVRAERLLNIFAVLSDKVDFSKSNFDNLLSELAQLSVHLSDVDEVVLHTGWAVSQQELRDVEFKS